MTARILGAFLLCASIAGATASASPTTAPTTGPSTSPSAKAKFPLPAELMAKWKAGQDAQEQKTKVAYFELDSAVSEKPSEFALFDTRSTTLRSLLDRLRQAKDDKEIKAVLVTLGAEFSASLAQASEIRDALIEIKKSGKKTFVFADSYDTAAYVAATGASDIAMMEGGQIMIPGVGLETMFYKGVFDKVGVKADYIQIGEYKGAEEPYTRTKPSDELRGELTKLVDSLYGQLVDGIATARNMPREAVQKLVDETQLMGSQAKQQGFVDHLTDQDGLRELIATSLGEKGEKGDKPGEKINLVHHYGEEARETPDFSNPFALLAMMTKKPEQNSSKPAVALIYAEGTIVDGDGSGGIFSSGGEVGSESMRKAIRTAARDENVKAIVIRIDSPGGSANASEVMWQAVRRAAKDKPVIISVGGMAASGGYYLASAGDYIFADPTGIVGSIGVVGGKLVMKDLFEKIGLSTERFAKGQNSGLFSSTEPWDDRQRKLVRTWMQNTYDLFTQRVMTTRTGKIADIDKVARGRIFAAKDAKELGLVDELGGTHAAIAYAAKRVNLKDGDYEIRALPQAKTLADFFNGSPEAANPFRPSITIAPDSMLRMLSPSASKLVEQQLQMIRLLNDRPVMLMSPYVMTTR